MLLVTVWLVQYLYCLFVILCGTNKTSIHAYPIDAIRPPPPLASLLFHPARIQARQDLVSNSALISAAAVSPSSPSSSPAVAGSSPAVAAVVQKPLIQIIAPNVTLFAALDLPSPSSTSSSSSPPSTPITTGGSAAAGNETVVTTPLLLPTSSFAITPSQIHHVNDTQMFGAGGSEPLTGVLIEWTIGCDLTASFPIYPPTEDPWIAFMSSGLLSNNNNTMKNMNDTAGQEDPNSLDDGDCDVSALISIVQAVSENVVGIIMYQDANATISFSELKMQTEMAIESVFYIQSPASASGMMYNPGTVDASLTNKKKRALTGMSREELVVKVAAMKQERIKASLEQQTVTKLSKASGSSVDSIASDIPAIPASERQQPQQQSTAPVVGIMALSDPGLIQILRTSANSKGEAVIAQMTFANNAFGPNLPFTPTNPSSPYSPTAGAERPMADHSLGLFFWIILGSVVLIVGIWVGFGVVEARSLSRRRQQIALDNVKLRTVDQKVLDTYTTKIFQEDDITYSDDEDDNEGRNGQTNVSAATNAGGSNGDTAQQDHEKNASGQGSDQADKKDGEEKYNDKDQYSDETAHLRAQQRVFARSELTAPRFSVAADRSSSNNNSTANSFMGRRSGSFDETLYGGLEAPMSRRASGQDGMFFPSGRRPSLKMVGGALNRDDRCRSWAENKPDFYDDYGGEVESESDGYGVGQENEYKSHAQEGWTNLQIEKIKSLDGSAKETEEAAMRAELGTVSDLAIASDSIHRGSSPSLSVSPAAMPISRSFTDASSIAGSSRRGSADILGGGALYSQPTLRHKSRFILPRKIETDLPALFIVPSEEIVSPTVYGDNASSTGPSTAGFLPPAGWGGERRRSSLSTVAVPDNGRGAPQTNWMGPQGQTLRRSSLQVHRVGSPASFLGTASEDSEYESEYSNNSDADDGRGVGQVEMSTKGKQLRRASIQVLRASLENLPSQKQQLDQPDIRKTTRLFRKSKSKKLDRNQDTLKSPISDHKKRFSLIGVDLPDIYAPTTGEFSRLSLDADGVMMRSKDRFGSVRQRQQPQPDSKEKQRHIEELCDPDSQLQNASGNGSGRASLPSSCSIDIDRHLTTAGKDKSNRNSLAGPSSASSTGSGATTEGTQVKKQRKRKYDPCAICLEEYEIGDTLRELPCRHFFHSQCIDPWFKDVHGICPVCKRDYSQAGNMTATSREAAENAERIGRSSSVLAFLSPLALFATGVSGGSHYWYAAEASIHM